MNIVKIVYEAGPYWVLKNGSGHHVMISGPTHSVSESSYTDLSLAVARADYLAKTHNKSGAQRFEKASAAARLSIEARLQQ